MKETAWILVTQNVLMVRKKNPGDSEPGEFSLYLKFQMLLGMGLFPR